MGRKSKYPVEVQERAVRLVLEQQSSYPSQWAAIVAIAACLSAAGCGQKGNLYLPSQKKKVPTTQSPPDTPAQPGTQAQPQ